MMTEPNLQMYPKCNPEDFPDLFTAHMSALTTENLVSKSDIATQLAYRDHQIKTLLQATGILASAMNVYHDAKFVKANKNET